MVQDYRVRTYHRLIATNHIIQIDLFSAHVYQQFVAIGTECQI